MKQPILWLLLGLSASLAAAPSFFMPDETDDALYQLETLIDSAQKHLLIITPELDKALWDRPLGRAAARGITVTLVTTGEESDGGTALVRFKGIDYRNVSGLQSPSRSGLLAMTLLIVDDTAVCTTALPLLRSHFEHDLGVLECYGDAESLLRYNSYAERILARSKAYLQP
jgi:hypothetical protein